MRKRYLASVAGAIGAGVTGYLLKDEENRNKLKEKMNAVKDKLMDNTEDSTLEEAGKPDQLEENVPAQEENSKMVSEGSQFGVQYYNKAKEEEDSK
ncbi:YtxH domain-containing protein [Virgibacillus siamensis]|uniref:YtxH domain-containing protein n=1 Tax=Virgibacillus siamensis TaxID=480071 RepID=UPI000986DE63|nr:YtxH domain-containing protein [Virgibacillus siamensis]